MTGGLRVWHACRLVRWDMRAREGAVQDSPVLTYQEGKDYASKPNFNCMATSGGARHAQLCPKFNCAHENPKVVRIDLKSQDHCMKE